MAFIPGPEYFICLKNLPIAAVDVVLLNYQKNKVLLFKRINEPAKNKYFSPGGRINKGEEIKKAARRKLKKETGIKCAANRLFFGGITEEAYPISIFGKKINTHYIDIVYGLILNKNFDEKKIKLDSQHSEFKWFKINDPRLHPYVKNKIKTIIDKI